MHGVFTEERHHFATFSVVYMQQNLQNLQLPISIHVYRNKGEVEYITFYLAEGLKVDVLTCMIS